VKLLQRTRAAELRALTAGADRKGLLGYTPATSIEKDPRAGAFAPATCPPNGALNAEAPREASTHSY